MKREFELLARAGNEIKNLRKQNELMAVRLDMFDKCLSLFSAQPHDRGMMATPDIVYDIEKTVEGEKQNIESKEKSADRS